MCLVTDIKGNKHGPSFKKLGAQQGSNKGTSWSLTPKHRGRGRARHAGAAGREPGGDPTNGNKTAGRLSRKSF